MFYYFDVCNIIDNSHTVIENTFTMFYYFDVCNIIDNSHTVIENTFTICTVYN